MKLRSIALGLSLLTGGTMIGVSAQQFASADVSSGDRPVLVPIEPCRLVDTRSGAATVGPRSSRLGAADTLRVDAQEADTPCSGRIPSDALSLLLNVTAIGATQQTFLTIWAGGARPTASSLNPSPGAPPTPNAVTVDLSVDQEFEVYNDLGSLNLVVDVAGYYVDHNHDDRYYTKAETDSRAAAGFAVQTEPETSVIDANVVLDSPDVAASTVVAVPGPGQLIMTATGTYDVLLGGDDHPSVECSLTNDGFVDPDHRSLYEVWNATPTGLSPRSGADLSIVRVIDVTEAGDVPFELLCFKRSSSGTVFVSASIVAQYIP